MTDSRTLGQSVPNEGLFLMDGIEGLRSLPKHSVDKGVPPSLPPKGSRCDGCPYWRGIGCVFCYREQLKPPGNGR